MRAVGLKRFGGPEVLELLELPAPQAGPGHVRVRVHAAAVNPTDTLIRSGAPLVVSRQPDTPPYVPGMDAAGVIDQVGPGVDDWLQIGLPVVTMVVPHGSHGAYAEQIVVPAESVVRAPTGADPIAASTLLMNAVTARLAVDAVALDPGNTLAVTGAAGTLGSYVIPLAKRDGLRVIADAKDSDVQLVRGFGADDVVERGPEVAARFRTLEPGGVLGVVDAALLNEKVLPALADCGRMATVREWDGEPDRGIEVHPIRARASATDTATLESLVGLVEEGVLSLRVARVFPAAQAVEAHQLMEAGGLRGRVVLDFR